MDIQDMNAALRALHASIADLQKYRAMAELRGDTLAVFNFDREVRELQTQARALQGQIDRFNTDEVML